MQVNTTIKYLEKTLKKISEAAVHKFSRERYTENCRKIQ